jgi:hypothetical protein
MVHIERVDLTGRKIVLPSDHVGMVIAQPFLALTTEEPFRHRPETTQAQLDAVSATLSIARAAPHQAAKTHFTIFPEYSIPGPDGIAMIEQALASADWPTGTIVMGGTDALAKDDFVALANMPGTHLDSAHNDPAQIADNAWVNCGIVWTKANNGTVERWLQPKLAPAWPELNIRYQDMFRGKSIFSFKGALENGTQYRFCALVCFDWIAIIEQKRAWRWAIEDLQSQAAAAQGQLLLSWLFVLQHNPQPSHHTFLNEVAPFFDQTVMPMARRERTCLLFANTAGKDKPGRVTRYGGTSLIFSQQTLFQEATGRPTISKGGTRFRSTDVLSAFRDGVFREQGACIHSFVQTNPDSVIAGQAGRTFAIDRASVFPFAPSTDPRTPSSSVPACVKWLNDELDEITSLDSDYPAAQLASAAKDAHEKTVTDVRRLVPNTCDHIVERATARSKQPQDDDRNKKKLDPDQWDHPESSAVAHVVHTLDLLRICHPVVVADDSIGHAVTTVQDEPMDVLAVHGGSHEACMQKAKDVCPLPRRRLLLVSRDRDNTDWDKKLGSILNPKNAAAGEDVKYSDPDSRRRHIGYAALLRAFRHSGTAAEMAEQIDGALAA